MKKVLITAGPTYEAIDPVRFIGNRSSGKMGYALAKAFLNEGCELVLVSGPVNLELSHTNLKLIRVESALEMENAVFVYKDWYDVGIMAAAVADFRPANVADEKIKKQDDRTEMTIRLVKNPDILAGLGQIKKEHQFLVGFALETENEEQNALKKLQKKSCDAILLNSLRTKGAGFNSNTNEITLYRADGFKRHFPLNNKEAIAREIAAFLLG